MLFSVGWVVVEVLPLCAYLRALSKLWTYLYHLELHSISLRLVYYPRLSEMISTCGLRMISLIRYFESKDPSLRDEMSQLVGETAYGLR